MLIQYSPPELFSANSAGVWKILFFFLSLGHLNESVSCMAGAIKTRWILLHMKSEGGGEAAVNPLAVLCLTDSIVLFRFLAAEDSPPRYRRTERSGGDEKREPAPHTHISKRQHGEEMSAGCVGGGACVERVWDGAHGDTIGDLAHCEKHKNPKK